MSTKARKLFMNVGLPALGFGVGWVAFTAVEQNNLLSDSAQRWLTVHNLKLQLYTQRLLSASVVQKYGYPEETLRSMIELTEKGYTEAEMTDRMSFDEVLKQCPVPEQMAFLEEHASEEIPYFYIADIFHSWANLNRQSYVLQEKTSTTSPSSSSSTDRKLSNFSSDATDTEMPPVPRNDPDFDSAVLCDALYDKMLHNVVPFDVSIRALCVLAVNNKANARRIAAICDPARVVELFSEYAQKIEADYEQEKGADVVAPEDVTAATLFFLRAVNDASIHRRWLPLLGKPSTGPYPLAQRVTSHDWCRAFGQLPSALTSRTAETATVLADVMSERLRCTEVLKEVQTVAS